MGDLVYYSAIIIVIVAGLFIALLCVSMRTVAPSNVGYIDFLEFGYRSIWMACLLACLFVCLFAVSVYINSKNYCITSGKIVFTANVRRRSCCHCRETPIHMLNLLLVAPSS